MLALLSGLLQVAILVSIGLSIHHGGQESSQHFRNICRICNEERTTWEVSLDPRRLRVLRDADQCHLDFGVPIHRTSEIFYRNVVLPEIGIGECDDKVVITVKFRNLVDSFLNCCNCRVTTPCILRRVFHLLCYSPAPGELSDGVTNLDKWYFRFVSCVSSQVYLSFLVRRLKLSMSMTARSDNQNPRVAQFLSGC